MKRQAKNSRIRVAFDQQIFVLQPHGGISRYFTRLAQHLPAHGVDATIVSPLYFTELLKNLPDAPVVGRHIGWSPRKARLSTFLGEHLQIPLVKLLGAKIVHETYYHPRRLAPKSTPIVFTVHDMIAESNLHIPEAVVDMENKREGLKRADRIICISEATRKDLLKLYPETESRTAVIHYGFDAEFAHGNAQDRLHSRPYILFVGVRRNYKNFEGLLESYASSEKLRNNFDLICVSHHTFTTAHLKLISDLGLEGKVLHRMAHNEDTLRNWYNHAAVLAHSSLHEGFGLPMLEAMAASCPVVCMNVSVMPEVCGEAAEYAEPGDPDSLRVALENVALSHVRADALRAAGRERIKLFSWRECARQTADVYRSLG